MTTPASFRFQNPTTPLQVNFNYLADTVGPNVAYNYLLGPGSSSGLDGHVQLHNGYTGNPDDVSKLVNNFGNNGQYLELGVGKMSFGEIRHTGIPHQGPNGRHDKTDYGPFGSYVMTHQQRVVATYPLIA